MPAPHAPDVRPPIDVYADPLTAAYENVVDRLMVNIAKHFNSDDPTVATLEWQFRKLAEMGKLTRENVAIIAELTGQNETLINEALTRAAIGALQDIEPQFAAAVKKGLLDAAAQPAAMSARVRRLLDAYQNQALETLNLVNTVMLRSSLEQYRKIVSNTMMYEKQLAGAQVILNQSTAAVVTGAQSRQTALRQAVKDMAAQGLTGITDRAGRNWSPEAYVNMDIRTTVGNVATEAVFERNQDYGNDLIWVRTKAAARPLCYPYQGKVISTSNREGVTEDLNGQKISFIALSSTSYGEPAGLFGINCGHKPPNVFIPGYSLVRGEPVDKEKNDRDYALSQQQRLLERKTRYAKRDAAMADAMGDKEAFANASRRVKKAQADYDSFIEKTGRTKRSDRTQVFGYDRSVAGKVTASVKAQAAKYDYVHHNSNGTIVVTDSRSKTPATFKPNAVLDVVGKTGNVTRTIYDPAGKMLVQINNTDHNNPRSHPMGPHAHDIVWDSGAIVSRNARELTETERKEHADIL